MKLSHIEKLSENPQWVEKVKEASVFFTTSYANYCEHNGSPLIYIYSDCFVIPVSISKKFFFIYASFMSEPYKYSTEEESLEEFLTAACDYVHVTFKSQWISASATSALFMAYPKGSKHIPFGSHVIDLSLSEEELWSKVHSKHRNVIKKSEKDGVVVESGRSEKLIRDYHSLDVVTWKRSNKEDAGLEEIQNQINYLGENAIIYMAYLDDVPQSGALLYYNQAMCYYMHGANCDKPHTGAGNLLQWKALLDMKAAGVKKYSFVGCRINEDENSKYHGIQRFKERFGGELIQGYLFKIAFNKPLYRLYSLLLNMRVSMAAKKFTTYQDVIDQEYHKWKE